MNSACFLVLVLSIISLAYISAQIPCDEAYGQHCPEASGYDVGVCLKKVDSNNLHKDCLDFIKWHDECRNDIDQHCVGKEYTGDALVCLAEWTKPDLISEQCKVALPKKEVKEKKMSDAEKKKAAERRK
jgi:hypothetical protein